MRRWLLLLLLLTPLVASGGNLHLDCQGDTACEIHRRDADWQTPWAVPEPLGNCTHGISPTRQVDAQPCAAYVDDGTYVQQAAMTLDYGVFGAAAGETTTCWLGLHKALGAPVAGWTRHPGTHYVGKCGSTARPEPPEGGALLGQVTLTADGITVFAPRAPRTPLFRAFGGQINVLDYGAKGDGVTDDHDAFERACQALTTISATQKVLVIPGGLTYKIDSTVLCDPPSETTVLAWGANVLATFDGVLFEINSTGDCSIPGSTSGSAGCLNQKFNVRWFGGRYTNNAPTPKSAAVVWKAYAMRGFWVKDTLVRLFWTTMDVAVQDNLHVVNNNWLNAGNFGYHILTRPDRLNSNYGSYYVIFGNTMSGQEMTSSIALLENQAYRTIMILDNNIGGRHNNNVHIISGSDFSGQPTQAVQIIGNHFEAEDENSIYIRLERTTSTKGFAAVTIEGNRLGSGLPDWTALDIADANGLSIRGNYFAVPDGLLSREIVLRGSLTRTVDICANWHDPNATALVLVSGALRSSVTVCPTLDVQQMQLYGTGYPALDGYNNDVVTAGGEVIDMSTVWPAFTSQTPRIVPKGYWITLQLHDADSAACPPSGCQFNLKRDATMALDNGLQCGVSGIPNNTLRWCNGYVPADANGDIYRTATPSSGSNMRVLMRIQALDM